MKKLDSLLNEKSSERISKEREIQDKLEKLLNDRNSEIAADEEALRIKKKKENAKRLSKISIIIAFLAFSLVAIALGMRAHTLETRPPASEIVGVTPAQFTLDYWFCFEADDQVRFEGTDMTYCRPDRSGTSRNGYGTGGCPDSVNRLFGRRITVTAVDPNKQVRFRIWENHQKNTWFACGGR